MADSAGGSRKKLTEAVEAFYFRVPTAAELAELGLKAKHYVAPDVVLWPEAGPAFDLFSRVCTQWRTGGAGAFALDHGVVNTEIAAAGITGEARSDLLDVLMVIEGAALKHVNET